MVSDISDVEILDLSTQAGVRLLPLIRNPEHFADLVCLRLCLHWQKFCYHSAYPANRLPRLPWFRISASVNRALGLIFFVLIKIK